MGLKSEENNNSEIKSTDNRPQADNGRVGIKGWLNPTRYGWERVSYWLQRLTGVGLLIYFVGHVYETSSLVNGMDAWNSMLELTQTTGGHIFLMLVIGASTFHTVNGIRLIFTESGIGLGKPGRPDYPYDATSLNYKQKSGIWVALILAAIAMLYGGMVMFGDAG
ncbi:succinate dehydrogenase [Candidatus Nitrosocosmicus franklandus]|uniref:Succinate dehydrogenase/Fumarate reductase transmembrane subunit n=1 Tax=Candidatus Nitrosocosmicus franklandianus TaxID=1798806 RepID=A0A484IDR5_9ARCH|nr:succinate dehydrogenase [Candidatus Nitrosocosmicus franklandus]VFJ14227.1 Succinate dehydrogenase/Fumarate reductase transmembrane subunit [Candidatus Nitrosocosmicus franklandus]